KELVPTEDSSPPKDFEKGAMAWPPPFRHPLPRLSELRENRISRTSDSRRADLFLHRPREKPRRGRLPPLSVSHGGERGAGRGAPDAPVGDDAERVSASI